MDLISVKFSLSVKDVMKKLQDYVDYINANIEKLDTRGPVSKYVLPNEGIKGRCVLFSGYDNFHGI